MMDPCSEKNRQLVIDTFVIRFGIDPVFFDDFGFYMTQGERVFLGPKRIFRPDKVVSAGLLIARIGNTVKPTTNLLQVIGKSVTKNRIWLTREDTEKYLMGEDIRVTETVKSDDATEGFVLMCFGDFPLGCGLYKAGWIKNQIPKAKRLDIKYW